MVEVNCGEESPSCARRSEYIALPKPKEGSVAAAEVPDYVVNYLGYDDVEGTDCGHCDRCTPGPLLQMAAS